MESTLKELISICEKQSILHRSLVTALEGEKNAIIESKLLELNKFNSEKEAIILKIKKLENKRSSIITKLAEDTAFPFTIGESATKINISFKPGDKKVTIEKFRKK